MSNLNCTLIEVTIKKIRGSKPRTWTIRGENIAALTNFLDWAENQIDLEEKQRKVSGRACAEAHKD